MNEKKILVTFYSRTGTTRKAAEAIRKELGCDIEEIIDLVDRKGFIGTMKACYSALKALPTVIKNPQADASLYDVVIIGTPVWAGRVSNAVRTYITANKDKFRNVAFFATMSNGGGDKVLCEMEELSGKKPSGVLQLLRREINDGSYLDKVKSFAAEIKA